MLENSKPFVSAGDMINVCVPAICKTVSFDNAHSINQHQHRRGQFIYAHKGAIQMRIADKEWYLPSCQALWIPAQQCHSLIAKQAVAYVSVFVDISRIKLLPSLPTLYRPSKLLHELILTSSSFAQDYDTNSAEYRLVEVLLDQLQGLPAACLELPMPQSQRLQKIIDDFIAQPMIEHSLANYTHCIGASLRTLQRQFRRETGYEFSVWRQSYLVQHAIALMQQGYSITRIAVDFGYKNSASFSTMFKRMTGYSPKQYLAQNQL